MGCDCPTLLTYGRPRCERFVDDPSSASLSRSAICRWCGHFKGCHPIAPAAAPLPDSTLELLHALVVELRRVDVIGASGSSTRWEFSEVMKRIDRAQRLRPHPCSACGYPLAMPEFHEVLGERFLGRRRFLHYRGYDFVTVACADQRAGHLVWRCDSCSNVSIGGEGSTDAAGARGPGQASA